MSIAQMRAALLKRTKYANSPRWINRVKAMPDAQVFAVYMRLLNAGELLK